MSASTNRVLFHSLPTRNELRTAIATIVRSVQLTQGLSDEEMGRCIGVSASTVRNARNEDADLGALAILSIGSRFGEDCVQPYADLMGAQLMPRNASHLNPIPALGTCIASMSVAHSPKQRRDALPAMRLARDVLNNCITETEQAA